MTLPATVTDVAGWPDHKNVTLGPFEYGADLFAVLLDATVTPTRPCVFRSQDGGHTWARQDAAGEPAGFAAALTGYRSATAAVADDPQFLNVVFAHTEAGGAGRVGVQAFDLAAAAWAGAPLSVSNLISPVLAGNATAPVQSETRQTDGTRVTAFQGTPEAVMGSAYRRVWYAPLDADGTPTDVFLYDVVNGTDALADGGPGTTVHYDLRGVCRGTDDRVLLLWTASTTSALQARLWAPPNTVTAVINPGSAVVSASAGYPLGVPAVHQRGGAGYYAVPYVDGAAVKVLRCACTAAATAGNWTVAAATATAGEQTASNPAALVTGADKLWLWRVTADAERDLFYANDQGGGGWTDEAGWKLGAAVTCNGLSARRVTGGLGVLYLDGSASPARVRYDRLVVLATFAAASAGTFTGAGVDLGEAPPAAVEVLIDVGAGADPAGTVEVAVEGSWDGGAWTPLLRAGPYDQTGITERIAVAAPPRYLRAVTAVGVDVSASGVYGIEGV